MDCRTTDRLITAWMDGELAEEPSRELEAHLSGCAVCSGGVAQHRLLRAMVRRGAPSHLRRPPALSPGRILIQERRGRVEDAALVRSLKRVAAVAALLTVASGVLLGWNGGSRQFAEADASITAVAGSPSRAWLEPFIDESNSIVLALSAQ